MRQFLVFLFMTILTPPFAFAEVELKGSPAELSNYLSSLPKEVSLTGEAKLEIQAESGIASIGIKTESPQLQKSLQKNQTLRSEIITQLIKVGISEDRIKGTKFSSTPEYGFFGKKPNNYVVENKLNITIINEKEFQEVAKIVDSYKNIFYQGLELKEQKKDEIKKKLLDMALANAKTRKKVYETELGITLRPIKFFEDISVEKLPVRQRHIRKSKMLFEQSSMSDSERSHGGGLSFGEHTYYGRVEIQYIVIPNKPR